MGNFLKVQFFPNVNIEFCDSNHIGRDYLGLGIQCGLGYIYSTIAPNSMS